MPCKDCPDPNVCMRCGAQVWQVRIGGSPTRAYLNPEEVYVDLSKPFPAGLWRFTGEVGANHSALPAYELFERELFPERTGPFFHQHADTCPSAQEAA